MTRAPRPTYATPRLASASEAEALVARALDPATDRAALEADVERLCTHADVHVRRACALALGHLARVRGAVDGALAQRVRAKLRADPQTRGAASDAMDDIAQFA